MRYCISKMTLGGPGGTTDNKYSDFAGKMVEKWKRQLLVGKIKQLLPNPNLIHMIAPSKAFNCIYRSDEGSEWQN